MKKSEQNNKNLIYHLKELKNRLINSIIFTLIIFVPCYYFIENILLFLLQPLLSNSAISLISTSITETFFTYLKFAIICAIGLSTPFYFSQFYLFTKPGLFKKEQKHIFVFLIAFFIMFLIGACFMYYAILPQAIKFLTKYANSKILAINLHAKISEYTATILHLIIGFGFAFQLPLALILLTKMGIITADMLIKKRRMAIVIIFTIAAIVTPPDILSQIMLGSVMILLYEITIVICKKVRSAVDE